MTSHGFLLCAKIVTCGVSIDESSNVPRLTVTNPAIALLLPKIELPHTGQNSFVT